ncbi:uncharacterized protein LOC107845474 isoform X4 [Capsicum annuum]|uniref:uncharacterized protein LOC107845474 isoform X4 n=1 Tax=Capsicum annuum TaxID=4072 RepID=UPI001FB11427|nr:uncharacterized protein LOC107845474 isoform X4 [Capsicum annuum]
MLSPSLDACKSFKHFQFQLQSLGCSSGCRFSIRKPNYCYPCISCSDKGTRDSGSRKFESRERVKGKGKGKDNVWSIDNEMAKTEKERDKPRSRRRKRGGKRMRNVTKKRICDRVMISSAMLMEVETVLQTQEPVILPAWNTFTSSVSGIWKGVGAVFSPITAEMEPIEIGNKNEHLFDCYTLSRIDVEPSPSVSQRSIIRRKVNWVTVNPRGEVPEPNGGDYRSLEKPTDEALSFHMHETPDRKLRNLPKFESFDLGKTDIMEEDTMGMEPGLVFFEDGSYSRGPVDIPVGDSVESKYYLSPTFKFEQCLVKGCHKRLRMVHTIEFSNGGSDIQILRVAVYEEQWVGTANLADQSDMELDVELFSQRRRVQPSELTGSWKVFEMSATPIYGEDNTMEATPGVPYVYLCTENLKKRSLPEHPVYFREEEMLDMQDATVLWLPGGVTSYVDVNKDGTLCIGVGWYSDEGVNLVMERDYETDGKLKEVRWKSEVKRRWTNPPPMAQRNFKFSCTVIGFFGFR